MIQLEGVIPPVHLGLIGENLKRVVWLDGADTADGAAKLVKCCSIGDPNTASPIMNAVRGAIERCEALRGYAWTHSMLPMVLVRYDVGGKYGLHTDAPRIHTHRADVSFTVFLNNEYGGGELVIETAYGPSVIKLAPGSIVAYPSTMLHRVLPVANGTRYVVVGWIRSLIRSAEQRELLSDIEMARAKLFEACGKCDEFDALTKASSNLQRMWMDD